MAALVQLAMVLLLTASTVLLAQRPGPPPGRSGQRTGRPPEVLLERWNRMAPDERKRLLDTLPPERRERFENRMQHFNELSPREKDLLSDRFQAFRRMPREKQERARQLFRQFSELPDDRRSLVRREFESLRPLPEDERRARMNSDEFRGRYSRSEQEFLHELTSVVAPPAPPPDKSPDREP